jgi:hypothetical protein
MCVSFSVVNTFTSPAAVTTKQISNQTGTKGRTESASSIYGDAATFALVHILVSSLQSCLARLADHLVTGNLPFIGNSGGHECIRAFCLRMSTEEGR